MRWRRRRLFEVTGKGVKEKLKEREGGLRKCACTTGKTAEVKWKAREKEDQPILKVVPLAQKK